MSAHFFLVALFFLSYVEKIIAHIFLVRAMLDTLLTSLTLNLTNKILFINITLGQANLGPQSHHKTPQTSLLRWRNGGTVGGSLYGPTSQRPSNPSHVLT